MTLSLEEFLQRSTVIRHHALLLLSREFASEGIRPDALRAIAESFCGIRLAQCAEESFWEEAARHPDFFAVDRERTILRREEELGPVRKLALYPPNLSRRRLFLIDRCERLNLHAANSLLKVLEEPGVNPLFLFTAKAPSDVMSTIVSRCQRVFVSFSNEKTPPPHEAFEEEDWRWLASCFAKIGVLRPFVYESLNAKFPADGLRASSLSEILDRCQSMGKRYERSVLQEGVAELLVEAMRHPASSVLTIARHIQSDLKRWRDSEAFHPSSEFWLARILLRLV